MEEDEEEGGGGGGLWWWWWGKKLMEIDGYLYWKMKGKKGVCKRSDE